MAREVDERTHGRHLLLLTDFDGTLAELAPTPTAAVVSDAVRAGLASLAALGSVTWGVVSGRRLSDVSRRVGPSAAYVAGLHGLEISGPESGFTHAVLDSVAPVISRLAHRGASQLAWCPGLYLEDKTFALTCHVRLSPAGLADRALAEFKALAKSQLDAHVLKVLPAVMALEVLPDVSWHKGHACEWIRDRVQTRLQAPVRIVYLGDDRTDEDAFAALQDDDLVIGVGARPHAELIDYRLAGPDSVGRFLSQIARLRGAEATR